MKDIKNEKLFDEVENIRRVIRKEIHKRCRNSGDKSPSAETLVKKRGDNRSKSLVEAICD